MSAFDEDLFLKGLEQRKATLGAEYVEKNLAAADDFTRPFQEAMTAWCWGFGWGDDIIDAKTRSMMNLSMIGALGKMDLSRFCAAPSARLSYLSFESDGAFPAQC
ncbi:hypothetical protein [Ascidiaceihabitans sp.]|uniref:hypothetical protein n=1 Tax=Ascidiaceihabitans sp. TaxID=1872644 RepID=UPI003299F3D9